MNTKYYKACEKCKGKTYEVKNHFWKGEYCKKYYKEMMKEGSN